MGRGRKLNKNDFGIDWKSLYRKNSGFYFNILIKELGKVNEQKNKNIEESFDQIKYENFLNPIKILPIDHVDIPFKIPNNWKWCRLNEVGHATIGIIFKPSQVGLEGIPVLRANNVQNNKIEYADLIFVDTKVRDKQIAKVGDILICVRSGSNNLIGKSALIEKEGMSFGAFMTLFRSKINTYVHKFMTSDLFKSQIDDKKSTGINQLTQNTLNNILIPIPPLSEQKQIINFFTSFENDDFLPQGNFFNIEIEKVIYNLHKSQIKAATLKNEFSNQLKQIENLNQAILQEAMQGKLVKQDKKDEPASELLKRIKVEKAKSGKKEKPLAPIKPEEITFEIPESWVWCRLGEICSKIGSGSTPKGSNYSNTGFPFFRSQNIHNEGLVYDDIKFVSAEVQKQMNGTIVIANDILLNITGGSLGRCALVPNHFEKGNVSQHVCIIRPLKVDINYFHKIVLSPYFQKLIFSSTTGAGREGLPKYNLEQFLIPLPPLSEQKRIVVEIEKQLTKTKQLKEHIIANQQATEQLLKALLHQAFEVEEVEEVEVK